MNNINRELLELEKEILQKQEHISKLKKMKEIYPDIDSHTNRWKKVRYISKSIINSVTDCEIYHNCGCCNDSPVQMSAFINTEFGRIYADSTVITIGEKCWNGGDSASYNWKETLEGYGFPEVIIKKCAKYFKDNLSYYELKEMMEEQEDEQ